MALIPRVTGRVGGRVSELHRTGVDTVRALRQPESRAQTEAMQIAKATAAAILAWYVAGSLLDSPTAWLATLTALLMVHSTVYRTIAEGIRRVVAVSVGLVLAGTAGNLLGLNALSLLVVVPLSLLFARLRWVGAQGEYIAVTAVVLLTFGMATDEQILGLYLRDTALGVAVGLAVNVLLVPPGFQRSAQAAVRDLATHIATVLREVADGARHGWDLPTAQGWNRDAHGVDIDINAATSAIEWSREGQRFNPWPRRQRRVPADRFHSSVSTLWHIAIEVQGLTRTIVEAVESGAEQEPLHHHLGPLLEAVAEVVETYGDNPAPLSPGLSAPVAESLEQAQRHYDDLADRLPTLIHVASELETAGALLQALRRMLGYLQETGQPPQN